MFSGALDSAPGSTTENNATSSSNHKPSPAYHAEPLGARKEEGHGKEEGYGNDDTGNKEGQGKEEGHGNEEGHGKEEDREQEEGHEDEEYRGTKKGQGKVQVGSGVYTPKSVFGSVDDGPPMLQVGNPQSYSYDSPPRSHRPGGLRRGYDQDDCSRSPELVMLWDDGEPPDEAQAQETVPPDQAQELRGRRQLWYVVQIRAVFIHNAEILIFE